MEKDTVLGHRKGKSHVRGVDALGGEISCKWLFGLQNPLLFFVLSLFLFKTNDAH